MKNETTKQVTHNVAIAACTLLLGAGVAHAKLALTAPVKPTAIGAARSGGAVLLNHSKVFTAHCPDPVKPADLRAKKVPGAGLRFLVQSRPQLDPTLDGEAASFASARLRVKTVKGGFKAVISGVKITMDSQGVD